MCENKFGPWRLWKRRNEALGDDPGVYAVALSTQNIDGKPFSWREEIIYVGMTNAASGLKGRLKQFDNTISGKTTGHGGADRVRFKYPDYKKLVPNLYVAIAPFKCNAILNEPQDLRNKGKVVKFEYFCFAHFVEAYRELPEFNKKDSPKYSKMVGVK